ncbi:MAG: molecular chaperone GrpE [Solirubrobacteraceae bacterium]|nr:molecular chaperone GrpE [Solirubrobacteraceae bacterium]
MATEEHRIEQEAPEGNPTPPAPAVPEEPAAQAAVPGAGAAAEPEHTPEPESTPEPELDAAALRERAGKADEYLALAQRTKADFENYRRRMLRDVKAAEARGMGRLARELLPAIDNLERAVAALEAADDDHHMTDGIRLVTSELTAALGRTGIEGYAAKGERFDPVCHEAVAQHAVEGTEPGTIIEVLQAGYRLNDAILRPARVIVSG